MTRSKYTLDQFIMLFEALIVHTQDNTALPVDQRLTLTNHYRDLYRMLSGDMDDQLAFLLEQIERTGKIERINP